MTQIHVASVFVVGIVVGLLISALICSYNQWENEDEQ